MKFSRKREAIMEAICATDAHPNAEWVYAKLKPDYPDLSLATVYRNIALFRQQGRVVCVATVNGQERYDAKINPHPHFICKACAEVMDMDVQLLEEKALQGLEKRLNITIEDCKINLFGLCGACMEKQSNDKEITLYG